MFRLLIVDDEFHIREGLKHHVLQTGLPIEIIAAAEDGETALRLFEEQRPDIVILDINLPDISGLEVARRIREKDEATPLLFLTGYESLTYIREAIGLQTVDYLLKPITKDELTTGLQKAQDCVVRQRKTAKGLEQKRSVALEYALLDLLLQRRSVDDTIEELLSENNSPLSSGAPYVVLCCDLDVIPFRVAEGDERQLYGYAFSRLAIEAASSVSGTLGAAIAPDRVILVLPVAGRRIVEAAIKQVRTTLEEYMGISTTIGISRTVLNLNRLPEAYREAVHAAEHKGWVGNGQVIPFESVQIVETTRQDLLDKEFILISEIRAGNNGAVLSILQDWSTQLGELPSRQVKMMATQLVLFVMRVVQSQSLIHLTQQNSDLNDPLLVLSQMSNGNEIIQYVKNYFVQVGRLIQQSKEAVVPRMFEQAKTWIRENLHEDASLNGLAQHLHLSPKYLSSRFKQVTGECFLDFLTRVRFERARELLLDSQRKVCEVAEAVGFGDTNYFSIAFKKNTGFTPTEFRKRYL